MLNCSAAEKRRLKKLVLYENEARQQGYQYIAGIDEVGRGPLAGPVIAAACIVPEGAFFSGIKDSKLLLPPQRLRLYEQIVACQGLCYGIGIVSHQEIDLINIYQATIKAMLQAVEALPIKPDFLLVDGLGLKHPTIPHQKIIKGDNLSQSIAAAAIIAKVTRDRLMIEYHKSWPDYGFDKHKGYGTPQHLKAIKKSGRCPIHRLSFEPFNEKRKDESHNSSLSWAH
jgi:ribonuclease HII